MYAKEVIAKMEFILEKNIHMYNHRLIIKCGDCTYSGIIEDNPLSENDMLIWLKDFNLPQELELSIRTKLYAWLTKQGYTCNFKDGKRV